MLLTPKMPLSDSVDDGLINIQYKYVFGASWEECGVSKADGYLTALGFFTREEVSVFCQSVNVLKEFSTEEFFTPYINNEDRQRLSKFGKSQRKFNLAPDLVKFTPVGSIFDEAFKPSYEDFFQALFSWLTHGDTPVKRAEFIAWWQTPLGEPSAAVRNPYNVKTDSTFVRKSFKEKVDAFLDGLRNPQKNSVPKEGSGNPFVDAVHYVKKQLLNVFLQPSNWGYASGTDVTVGVQTPVKLLSASAGGGGFAVFQKDEPEKVFPLKFAVAGIGTGFGPSSPININVNPQAFASVGKIYQGLGTSIIGSVSFYGAFVTLSAGAADVVNQSTSLMFIAPIYAMPAAIYPGMDGARWAQIFASVIPCSSAILALDGNGIEASISVSAQLSCGFIAPKK